MNPYRNRRTNARVMAGVVTEASYRQFTSLFGCRVVYAGNSFSALHFMEGGKVKSRASSGDWVVQSMGGAIEVLDHANFHDRYTDDPTEVMPIATHFNERFDDDDS